MLDLEVRPQWSLGNEQLEFVLGMPFYQAVLVLKQLDMAIKSVQVWYSNQNPLLADLVINLPLDGVRLIFDSALQRLKVIEVYQMTKVKLKYGGVPFNGPNVNPTVERIEQSFGATRPVQYNKEKQMFILNFRGLSFEFKVESKPETTMHQGIGALQFPSGISPFVSRMFLYTGNSLEDTRPPAMPQCCFHGNCYLESLDVVREGEFTKEFRFSLITEGNGPSKMSDLRRVYVDRVIRFGDTVQDVLSKLGCPNKVFYKNEDKMKIHAGAAHRHIKSPVSNYFFNYFTLGVDILFDARVNRVLKVILHTNFPGHYNFNIYYRCFFNIPVQLEQQAPVTMAQVVEGKACPPKDRPARLTLKFNTKWEEVSEYLVPKDKKPVVLNRASTTNSINPYGSTFCHGVQDMIIEVMKNGHISSVTFYQARRQAQQVLS